MRYLVHFSGGVDSVVALLDTLQKDPTGNYDILHVKLKTYCPNFWKAQLVAVKKLIPRIQEMYRGACITLLEPPSFDLQEQGDDGVLDNFITTMFSILLLKKHHKAYTFMVHGNIIPIEDNHYWVRELELLNLYGISTEYHMPNTLMSKEEIYDKLPDVLKDYVWGCFSPRVEGSKLISCGRCAKCKELLSAGIQLAEMEMSEIEEIKW